MIPATELDICCCANGYKNAGKKLPINPQIKIKLYLLNGIFFNAIGKKGSNATALNTILSTEI